MLHRSVMVAGLLALAVAAPAAAQSQPAPRTQSIGGGVQFVYPIDGGYINGTPGANASWRRWFGPNLGVEGAFGWWRRSTSTEFSSPAVDNAYGGVPAMEGFSRSRMSAYSVGVNVLGRIPAGRVAVIVGGGPGVFLDRSTYEARLNAQRFSGSANRRQFGLQMAAELEVMATDRVALFGGLRGEMRGRDIEGLVGYPTVGVRVGF